MSGYFGTAATAAGASCAARRKVKRQGPTYPLVKTPVLAGGTYYVQFTLQITPTVFQNAYFLTTTASENTPVIIQTDSIIPACPAPITTATTIDINTQMGVPLTNPGPVVFSVVNALGAGSGSTFIAGTTVDVSGTLTYARASSLNPLAYTGYEFYLNSIIVPCTASLVTSNTCTVQSNADTPYVLCAVPLPLGAPPNQFQLRWCAAGATQGYVVSAVTLMSLLPCAPCGPLYNNLGGTRLNLCQCAFIGAPSGVVPL